MKQNSIATLFIIFCALLTYPTESFQSSGGVPTLADGRRNLGRKLSNSADEDDEAWRQQIDGGGDLTDRFKHKVHALMGTYDPPPGATDDENQMGFITGAFLQFPTEYTFSVIGKTNDGDAYVNDVKCLMESILGSDVRMETRVVPRGTKFTRVNVKVNVESAAMITSIYEELDSMELTVMKF